MTVDQIEHFLERLSRNQITGEEMQALTVGDRDLLNAYLAGRSRAFRRALLGTEGAVHTARSSDDGPTVFSRSYSEREILKELGITD